MDPGVAPDGAAYLPAKISQVAAVPHARQVAECLIDAVYLDARAHFLKRGHYPLAHITVYVE
ncbi:hypothetical protein BN136_4291 [Cronobacter universalis NCTC 9529]|nr:hypothetical protein BN136_4291 [Cronobacter universalis NCTC 9529]